MLKNGVNILSIDGKDIYISNNYKSNTIPEGYKVRNRNGDLNLKRFINTLDYSLDLIKMQEVYENVYRRKDFSFNRNGKDYTQRIINVTFKYNNKLFNRVRNGVYIKFGYAVEDLTFEDCVALQDGELVGVEVDKDVETPVAVNILGKYFYYKDGVYKAKANIPVLNSVANIREELYKKGFICDGIKYVRFKRSAGSSRVGKCLFIDERLYQQMHKWEMCGIKVNDGQDVDLAALEPYIALTLSSIIDTIQIRPENILVVKDYKSIFKDTVVATRFKDGRLDSRIEEVEISNSIWDGQSLMDRSVFLDFQKKQKQTNPDAREHGMLLLRARFFKSCCFNSNIQQWFADNGITDVKQLNGETKAERIEDIKLITTPSSIKYLKFGKLEDWFSTLDYTFGVVKHEKPTHFFDGRMVQTHYQLLNTLQMTYEEVEQLVKPSLDYAELIKKDPEVLRYHINFHYKPNGFSDTAPHSLFSRNDVVFKLLGINNDFSLTRIYDQFRKDLLKSYISKLRQGHILVNGNYSTICGNPIEMLKQAIDVFDGTSIMDVGTVHSTRFENNKELIGSRSPHVTVGNILITHNVLYEEISKYMNPTNEIVYINSIGENILERLSGADFDSDTILLTDNNILIQAAKRNYDKFPVPTKLVESEMRRRKYTDTEKADLDIRTSVNKIGEIINLSQELNSILWDRLYHGASVDDVMELYCDISQLDVMSNLEIDSAKRENPADNTRELQLLKTKYDVRDDKGRHIRPIFFRYLDESKGYRNGYYIYDEDGKKIGIQEKLRDAKEEAKNVNGEIEKGRMSYRFHETSMDYLQKYVDRFSIRTSKKGLIKFSDMLIPADMSSESVCYSQIHKVIDCLYEAKEKISSIWSSLFVESFSVKAKMAAECRAECSARISKMKMNDSTMLALLKQIESEKHQGIKVMMFTILFNAPNHDFYRLIRSSQRLICGLNESESGNIRIYDFTFEKAPLS